LRARRLRAPRRNREGCTPRATGGRFRALSGPTLRRSACPRAARGPSRGRDGPKTGPWFLASSRLLGATSRDGSWQGADHSCTTIRVPALSSLAMTPCQPSGSFGLAQKKRCLASRGDKFTQPWLVSWLKLECQKAACSAYEPSKYIT